VTDIYEDEFADAFARPSKRPRGKARRAREAKPVSHEMRRAIRAAEVKNVQLNLRVTETFRSSLSRLAMAHGLSLVETVEMAVEKMAGRCDDAEDTRV
jgi:hypothetical protein